jgi:serpin B
MDRRMFLKASAALAALPRMGWTMEPDTKPTDIAASCNGFAFDLYARLRKREGNQSCSPFSVESALAMTSLGARGSTAEQMNQTLHLPQDSQAAHAAFADFAKRVISDRADRGYQLSVANALWGANSYPFRKDFLAKSQEYYGAGLMELDFAANPEAARGTINNWVEKQTHERIKDLMPSGSISADTRLVLTNAIWFKGTWQNQFDKKATSDELFHQSPDKSAKVPMMHRTGSFGYFADNQVQVLGIPYRGREMSMAFLLPAKKGDLASLEQAASADSVKKWLGSMHAMEVVVTLPKFKIASEFQLARTLSEMGMTDAFSGRANFSGMSEKEGLMISQVIHKAFVEVNEEGAEAAGATGVVMRPTAMKLPDRKPPVFRADEPFLFLIRDEKSGCILFLGRVSNPA